MISCKGTNKIFKGQREKAQVGGCPWMYWVT
jgi:hypothetical protein